LILNPNKRYTACFKYFATGLVFLAIAALLSRDAVNWFHQLSHHSEFAHSHHDHDHHHHCGESTSAFDSEKCKPESCEHEGHLSEEAEPCFWCNLPLASIYAENILKNTTSTLFKTESAFLTSSSFFFSELKSPASNRGPPCFVFVS
jgi:hypothetical protein